MSQGEFSVTQFFPDDSYETVYKWVDAETAVEKAMFYSHQNVASRLGFTRRVIITDGGDNIVWEWKYGEGVVFPQDFQNVIPMEQKP